ncbi:unnamed protein product [Closterium sp. NIES-65]|nr:unnamed protein product [Closterium sp. NIES-65]
MKPVLMRKGLTMRPAEEGDAVMGTYRTALGDLMDALPGSMVAANLVAHTAVAIPRTKGRALVPKGAFIKASPKEKWFTDFAVKSSKKEECVAAYLFEEMASLVSLLEALNAPPEKVFTFTEFPLIPTRVPLGTSVDECEQLSREWHMPVCFVYNATGCVRKPPIVVLRREDKRPVHEGRKKNHDVKVRYAKNGRFSSEVSGFKAGVFTSTEWTRAGIFPRPPLHEVLYKLFMACKLTMPGTIQRSWWRAGSVPKGWLSRMDSLKGKAAAGMFDGLVLHLTSLQLVIEEFKGKCSSTAFMTAWDFVGCDEGLIEKWAPARGLEDESEDEIPAYFCIPEGPLMRDSRSCRRVSRMVHDGFVKQAEALGIPPRDVPEEAGVVNEEVVSRLRRTPTKRNRTCRSSDEGITSDASDEAGQSRKAGVLFPVEDDKESVVRLV